MKKSQKQATYEVVMALLEKSGKKLGNGKNAMQLMDTELLYEAKERLMRMFKQGKVRLKETETNEAKLDDDKLLARYVYGLIFNWLRKDERLSSKKTIRRPKF